jgi:hypothetical protein
MASRHVLPCTQQSSDSGSGFNIQQIGLFDSAYFQLLSRFAFPEGVLKEVIHEDKRCTPSHQ